MNELKVFNSEEFGDVRTVTINGDPWFVGKDVAAALGFTNPRDAISTHVFDEDKGVESIDTLGGKQKMTVINESGLYALVFGSRLKSAQRFKHWVTSEVLPAIRRTGGYQVPALQGKELLALAVLEAQKTILIGDLAKLLKQNGVETGQKRLFDWMREKGYLIKRKGSDWNMPTQKAMNMKLFEVKESTVNNPDGSVRINRTTKVTGRGQTYFVNKFLDSGNHRNGNS